MVPEPAALGQLLGWLVLGRCHRVADRRCDYLVPDMSDQERAVPQVEGAWCVGTRYIVKMVIDRTGRIEAEWEPDAPNGMSKQELSDYRRGRNALIDELARLVGGNILVAEI